MTAPISDGAVAEGNPPAPPAGQVGGVVGPVLGWAQPQVPIEGWWDRVLFFQSWQVVETGIHCAAAGVDGMDVADGAVLDPLAEKTNRLEGMALVAQLSDYFVLLRGFHQLPHLVDRVGQRFLAIDRLLAFD